MESSYLFLLLFLIFSVGLGENHSVLSVLNVICHVYFGLHNIQHSNIIVASDLSSAGYLFYVICKLLHRNKNLFCTHSKNNNCEFPLLYKKYNLLYKLGWRYNIFEGTILYTYHPCLVLTCYSVQRSKKCFF